MVRLPSKSQTFYEGERNELSVWREGPGVVILRNISFLSRRFVSNDELFDDLVSRAVQTDGHRWAVGGNAPVMALRFALEGARVLLSAKITEDMRKDLHESIEVAESSVVDKDDVHLILVLANLLLLTRQFLTSSQGGTEPHF